MHVSKKIEENDTFCIIGNSTCETFTYDNMPSCAIILKLWCSWIVETLSDSICDVLIKFQTDIAFCTYYKKRKNERSFWVFVLTSYGEFLMFLWHITKSDLMSWHWVDLDSWIVRVLFTAVSHILFF